MTSSSPLGNVNLVLIDNQDSFTYNLVDELRVLGVNLCVYRNKVDLDKVLQTLENYEKEGPTLIMLSPGPGSPREAGNMPLLLEKVKGRYPVLGICLGHQAIIETYQGKVSRASEVMHGKSSLMQHNYPKIFKSIPSPMPVARYHSLAAAVVPECLQIIASINNIPMAILHETDKMLGFQFHPESILTSQGSQLLLQAMQFLVSDIHNNAGQSHE